jgi:lycopene cyclase domain-containing protein
MLRSDQRLKAAIATTRAGRPRRIDIEVAEVTSAPASTTENFAADDEAAANPAYPAEIGRNRVRLQVKFASNRVQGCQLAVVGDANMNALNSEIVERPVDFRAQRKRSPLGALGQAHCGTVRCNPARHANFDRNQVLIDWQPIELGTQLALQFGVAGVCVSSSKITGNVVAPQLAPSKSCGGKLESVDVDAYAEDAPRLAIEVNRTGRPAGTWPANRVELFDDSACPEFADEVRHCRDAEPAAARNVMAATSSMVAYVAEDLSEISLPQIPRTSAAPRSQIRGQPSWHVDDGSPFGRCGQENEKQSWRGFFRHPNYWLKSPSPLYGWEVGHLDHFQYLLLMAACLLITLPLEFILGARVYRRAAGLVFAIIPVVIIFSAWDIVGILRDHWSYSPRFTTGVKLIFGMPIEELVFFIVVPICGLLTYEAVGQVLRLFRRRSTFGEAGPGA